MMKSHPNTTLFLAEAAVAVAAPYKRTSSIECAYGDAPALARRCAS
jgi:hypothetical protein